MGQLINFLSNSSAENSCGLKAIAPIFAQSNLTVTAGAGGTPIPLFTTVASGQPALSAGQITNKGCAALRLTLSYLTGSDCSSCTLDVLTPVVRTVIIRPDSTYPLPSGLVVSANFETGSIDNTGTFTASNVSQNQELTWYSEYQPCCSGPVLVP